MFALLCGESVASVPRIIDSVDRRASHAHHGGGEFRPAVELAKLPTAHAPTGG